jgi:hypothetical protein
MKKTIALLTAVSAILAIGIGLSVLAPPVYASGSAASTGAATDDGVACSGASGSSAFRSSASASGAGDNCAAAALDGIATVGVTRD